MKVFGRKQPDGKKRIDKISQDHIMTGEVWPWF